MELLVPHLGADFDAFASALVLRRLHPAARLFFPGSREGSVRRMLEARGPVPDELRQRDVDPAALARVILCDTRQRERLGVVGEWLHANPTVEVLAYDHHPDSPSDVPVSGGRVDAAVGATSTLVAEALRESGARPEPEEATLLLMGIYEDTGSLSYPTTSARDLSAAAWLLESGGDLDAVRRWALHSPDRAHLDVLHRMTEELEVVRVHGQRVGIVALELGGFLDELAPLVSRCLELFDLPLLFAVFGEGDRTTIIGRGHLPGFHLGQALAEVAGGGGHDTAAAGSVKGATPLELRERLLRWLEAALPPTARARDLMIAPVTGDRKSTRLNSSHLVISYAVFCLKKKTKNKIKCMRLASNYRYVYKKATNDMQHKTIIFDAETGPEGESLLKSISATAQAN